MRTSKILPISLPPEMLEDVEQLAKKERRTKSELVREALRRYIEDREWEAVRAYSSARARALASTGRACVVARPRCARSSRTWG